VPRLLKTSVCGSKCHVQCGTSLNWMHSRTLQHSQSNQPTDAAARQHWVLAHLASCGSSSRSILLRVLIGSVSRRPIGLAGAARWQPGSCVLLPPQQCAGPPMVSLSSDTP
jgi:hypothetical protein